MILCSACGQPSDRGFIKLCRSCDAARRSQKPATVTNFPDLWRYRRWLPERFNQPCRVIARGRGPGPRNVEVEFEDGYRTVSTWRAVKWRSHRLRLEAKAVRARRELARRLADSPHVTVTNQQILERAMGRPRCR